jgi:hypothetical protein
VPEWFRPTLWLAYVIIRRMADVFISYARVDRAVALRIAGALEVCGWSVWLDSSMVPGQDFVASIQSQLGAARCVLVLWSEAAVHSEYVRDEAGEAKRESKLVAARIEDIDPPLGFRQRHVANLVSWMGDAQHPEFVAVVSAVARLAAATRPSVTPGLASTTYTEKSEQNRGSQRKRPIWTETWLLGLAAGTATVVALSLGASALRDRPQDSAKHGMPRDAGGSVWPAQRPPAANPSASEMVAAAAQQPERPATSEDRTNPPTRPPMAPNPKLVSTPNTGKGEEPQGHAAAAAYEQRSACESRCASALEQCSSKVQSADDCLAKRYPAACVDACVKSNHSHGECIDTLCRPTMQNNRKWSAECETLSTEVLGRCEDGKLRCIASCS